jgi:hypothetical protein
MPRVSELGGHSSGDVPRGVEPRAEPLGPRLSQQQKDWIRETIDQLKQPIVVPDALQADAE